MTPHHTCTHQASTCSHQPGPRTHPSAWREHAIAHSSSTHHCTPTRYRLHSPAIPNIATYVPAAQRPPPARRPLSPSAPAARRHPPPRRRHVASAHASWSSRYSYRRKQEAVHGALGRRRRDRRPPGARPLLARQPQRCRRAIHRPDSRGARVCNHLLVARRARGELWQLQRLQRGGRRGRRSCTWVCPRHRCLLPPCNTAA